MRPTALPHNQQLLSQQNQTNWEKSNQCRRTCSPSKGAICARDRWKQLVALRTADFQLWEVLTFSSDRWQNNFDENTGKRITQKQLPAKPADLISGFVEAHRSKIALHPIKGNIHIDFLRRATAGGHLCQVSQAFLFKSSFAMWVVWWEISRREKSELAKESLCVCVCVCDVGICHWTKATCAIPPLEKNERKLQQGRRAMCQ